MIEDEMTRIPELAPTGIALTRFAIALTNGQGTFELAKTKNFWVMRPKKFVTFTIQYERARTFVLTFRGKPEEFEVDSACPLRSVMDGYSRCCLDKPRQLLACARYIDRAYTLFNRGRNRKKTRPVTTEIPLEGIRDGAKQPYRLRRS